MFAFLNWVSWNTVNRRVHRPPLPALIWVPLRSTECKAWDSVWGVFSSFPVKEFSIRPFVPFFLEQPRRASATSTTGRAVRGPGWGRDDASLILHTWCVQPLRSYLRVVTDNFSAWFKANSCWFDCLATKKWRMTLKMDNSHKSPHSNAPRKKI